MVDVITSLVSVAIISVIVVVAQVRRLKVGVAVTFRHGFRVMRGTPGMAAPARDADGRVDLRATLLRKTTQEKVANCLRTGELHRMEGIDDLTLQWLGEHTVLCVGCGTIVEKEGLQGRCCCHCHESNLIDHVRDANGQLDLRSTIMQRKVRQECEQQRRRAYAEIIPDRIEKIDYWYMISWYDWAGVV
mmetsp:Transcript_7992/g.14009  ORF Transcript_7992/g.14009 Transcript_7992/m.14009 type:complete len:189 (+) Transcript_7992:396-962(+)